MKILSNQSLLVGIPLLLTSLFIGCSSNDDEPNNQDECANTTLSDEDIINFSSEGITFDSNLISLFHNNINVSDYEASIEFYKLLGFTNLFGASLPINISDPDEAQGINLDPYQLDVSIIQINDGFVIDLIKYNTLFNDEAPNDDFFDLGFSALSLKTDNLKSDIDVFKTNNIEYTILNGTEDTPAKISFTDPSGTIIILTEVPTEVPDFAGTNSSGQTSIYGLYTLNINVSNLDEALNFYTEVGFTTVSATDKIATITMPDNRHITLTESCNTDAPYENANHLGIARIAIVTSDIDADIKRLNSKDIETYTSESITPSGALAILRYVAFEDPDGTIIELIEYL